MENTPPISASLSLAVFAHERGDARVMKRVAAFQAAGWTVRGYMFHRIRDREEVPIFWENVELGVTENRRYVKRGFVFLGSLWRLWQARDSLAKAQAF